MSDTAGDLTERLKRAAVSLRSVNMYVAASAVDEAVAEREERELAERKAQENYDWMISVCENPPPPTEALKKLFREYSGYLEGQPACKPADQQPDNTQQTPTQGK